MLTVPAGQPLLDLITKVVYPAGLPVLLHGRHGIGKSALLAGAASSLGIDLLECDLSLMEPPDLVGIPRAGEDGRTRYAPPSFLPTGGSGLLVFEELNRCPRYMQAPCLQLLTARRLNDYRLPDGWLPCAAVNDTADGGYLAEELDPALLSRFMRVRVVPDVNQWVTWAQQSGVHEKVIAFVQDSPGVFEDPAANPRAWHYASRLLTAWEQGEREREALTVALAEVLGEKWALALLRTYLDPYKPLQPSEILDAYPAHRARLRSWIEERRLDLVAASIEVLKRHLQPRRVFEALVHNEQQLMNVEGFFGDLPPDLKRQVSTWLEERGFVELILPKVARRSRS